MAHFRKEVKTRLRRFLPDVLDEQFDHRLGAVEQQSRSGVMELEGNVVVGVDAGSNDDVDRPAR